MTDLKGAKNLNCMTVLEAW